MPSFLDRLFGRPQPAPRSAKAVTDISPWAGKVPLSLYSQEPQEKAKAYLAAYKVGWFYKAGKKIANDYSRLAWTVSDGDADSGEQENTLDRPDLDVPFASLSPIEQFMRLMEKPNPSYTGRVLREKTMIRHDFGGLGVWYLEGGAGGGLPTAIYGISPSRMWPSYDKAGRLIGWVMDKDRPEGGVPFDVDEIVPFSAATEDESPFGVSVVEAVYAQVPITDLMARHTANVMTTGGRLAGMLWPKERALSEDEYQDALRAWRNVASDPNAAKRLLVFPEPMEYAPGSSTPQELGVPELAALNRDEILSAFPIDPRMLGVPFPDGLNASGETRKELRREYWENTQQPRIDAFDEVIQTALLARYEEVMGQTYKFHTEVPNLDDAASLTAKAEAYKALVSIGFDPKESVAAVGLDEIKWLGLPELLDPAKQAEAQRQEREAQTEALSSRAESFNGRPDKTVKGRDDIAKAGIGPLVEFFEGQRERVIAALREMPSDKKARREALKAPDWWKPEVEDKALRQALLALYMQAGKDSMQVVADRLDRIVPNKAVARIVDDLLRNGASRIKDINDRTLQALTIELAEGARRGYSISQLIDGVPEEGFKGVTGLTLDNGTPVFGDYRAEVIARTETALSMNRAALDSYQEFGVKEVLAYDGDEDPECAERNGQVFSLDDAFAIEDHPNGTLDWAPVTDKAAHEPVVVNVTLPEMKLPDVHVEGPSINVEGPVINLPETKAAPEETVNQTFIIGDREAIKALEKPEPPVVNVDLEPVLEAVKALAEREQPVPQVNVKAEMPKEMRITGMPARVTRKRVERDSKGRITETTDIEEDA